MIYYYEISWNKRSSHAGERDQILNAIYPEWFSIDPDQFI